MDKRCILDIIVDFNEKLRLYNHVKTVLLGDEEQKMLKMFGPMEIEEPNESSGKEHSRSD